MILLWVFRSKSVRIDRPRSAQIGYYSFAICIVSFALEQLFYLSETASLVPKWIPPGQMFWAMATTAAFALAAICPPHRVHGVARVGDWQRLCSLGLGCFGGCRAFCGPP